MPKVLFLADDLSNGGAERQLALLVKYLSPEWERRVWSLGDGPFAAGIRKYGAQVTILLRRWRWDISPTWNLWRLIRDWRPDVVHSWGWMGSSMAGPISKLLKVPLIDGTIRMGMVSPKRGLAQRWSAKWAKRVIANSQAGLIGYKIDSNYGRVVYNGFDPTRLALCNKAQIGPSDISTVVMSGRMVIEKDYQTYFGAARKLSSKLGSDWKFIALGDGKNRNDLVNDNKDLIQSGLASFPEPGIEILDSVMKAQVGVLMSNPILHAEGCSNSIMEYMACGLPVICSDSGGNRELVIEGETGFIIPPGNPDILAEKLVWLRQHPQEAQAMGERGRQRILNDFSVEKMVSKTIEVYREVLPAGEI